MKQKKKRNSPLLKYIPPPKERKPTGLSVPASDDSLPTQVMRVRRKRVIEEQFIPVHLTVRMHPLLQGRNLSLVTGQYLFQICTEGVNLEDIIFLEALLCRFLGQKLSPIFLKESKELEIALCIQSVIFGCSNLNLSAEKQRLPERISSFVLSCRYIPGKRVADSRKERFSPRKWMTIHTVPVDRIIEKSSFTIPYDSYCKGYGESHPSQHKKKTRWSPELDGEEVDFDKERSLTIPLLSISFLLHYQELETSFLGYFRT